MEVAFDVGRGFGDDRLWHVSGQVARTNKTRYIWHVDPPHEFPHVTVEIAAETQSALGQGRWVRYEFESFHVTFDARTRVVFDEVSPGQWERKAGTQTSQGLEPRRPNEAQRILALDYAEAILRGCRTQSETRTWRIIDARDDRVLVTITSRI